MTEDNTGNMSTQGIDSRAVFTDQTGNFLRVRRDGSLCILLRTGKGEVDRCMLSMLPVSEEAAEGEPEAQYAESAEGKTEAQCIRMRRTSKAGLGQDSIFDFFQAVLPPADRPFLYWFVLEAAGQKYVFTRRGLACTGGDAAYYAGESEWDEVVNAVWENGAGAWYFAPGFEVPDWAKGAVMYQIFTDRFANGDEDNDVATGEYMYNGAIVEHRDWDTPIAANDVCSHYGGDLKGIMDKLDYLQGLGIEVLYLNPIFLSPSNHKYDAQDYDHIDPHFGKVVKEICEDSGQSGDSGQGEYWTQAEYNQNSELYIARVTSPENLEASDRLFADLVREAHARGMRVIIDGVFNHCGASHYWMDRDGIYTGREGYAPGAYQRQDSPYHDFFEFIEEHWPEPPVYDGWWGYETLPKLNYEASKELVEEILRVAAKWVSPPFNADGWRLDVAADLGHSEQFNHYFWQRFRKAVKEANPDALILAENYADSSAWLGGREWDGIMNYEGFMDPVGWFLTGMDKHCDVYAPELIGDAEAFWRGVRFLDQDKIPQAALSVSMNQLSNHDHTRFLTRTSRVVGRLGKEKGPEYWSWKEALQTWLADEGEYGNEYGNENDSDWDSAVFTSRDAERGTRRAVFKEAAVLQMTFPGAPTVYYGDEAGLCGFTDPDNRRPYPWGREDQELVSLHRELIRIRHENSCLRNGSLVRLHDEFNVLSYGRFDEKGSCVVVINNRDEAYEAQIPVGYAGVGDRAYEAEMPAKYAGVSGKANSEGTAKGKASGKANKEMVMLLETGRDGFVTGPSPQTYAVRDGQITIRLEPESAIILKEKRQGSQRPPKRGSA